jgi:hypothetical protein
MRMTINKGRLAARTATSIPELWDMLRQAPEILIQEMTNALIHSTPCRTRSCSQNEGRFIWHLIRSNHTVSHWGSSPTASTRICSSPDNACWESEQAEETSSLNVSDDPVDYTPGGATPPPISVIVYSGWNAESLKWRNHGWREGNIGAGRRRTWHGRCPLKRTLPLQCLGAIGDAVQCTGGSGRGTIKALVTRRTQSISCRAREEGQ